MDDGERLLAAMYKLLIVFLVLDSSQSREYQRALTMSIHLWEWMRVNDHAGWHIFRQNASAFNEESGEIAFSVLARDLASSGIRSDIKSVSRKFGMIKAKMTVAKGLEVDLCGDGFSTHDHCVVQVKSAEVEATVAFFKGMIRNLNVSRHHHYGVECGYLDANDRRNAAPRKMISAVVLDSVKLQTSQSQLDDVTAGLESKLHQYWVYPFQDIWPVAQPNISGDDSDNSSAVGQAEQKCHRDPPMRCRRRAKRIRRDSPPAVVDDSGDDETYIGRVVSCPSWCIGQRWSEERYGSKSARNKARLHGVLSESNRAGNYRCTFYNDSFPDINLTLGQVKKWVVSVDDEAGVEDTPFLHPEETSSDGES